MENRKVISNTVIWYLLAGLLMALLVPQPAPADYLKMSPTPDVDKRRHLHGAMNSCWMAAAANMLAGAGYGHGSDPNERSDDIYKEMCIHFDPNLCNWADTAMNWWLFDANNVWQGSNPYTNVNVYGRSAQRRPWANVNLPKIIGNHVRDCNMVRLSIRKPTCDTNIGTGGHAITFWGDDGESNELTGNPNEVKVSDSDYWNWMEDVQTYDYDDYNNPNPGDTDDCNEGVGWYIDYSLKSHWYIDDIVVLSPVDNNTPQVRTLVGSLSVQYNGADPCATKLYYTIATDNNSILSYRTDIDWDTDTEPDVTEGANEIDFYWDLSDDPVPQGTTVKITAEIVVPYDPNGSSVSIRGVRWSLGGFEAVPGALWHGRHRELAGGAGLYNAPNMCGGYLVCAFNIYADNMGGVLLGEYRFQLRYDFYQDPEDHNCIMVPLPDIAAPPPPPPYMGMFRCGHSYGLLLDDELWNFNDWKTTDLMYPTFPPLQPWLFDLHWDGQLPYPKGQDYKREKEADKCGDPGTNYLPGDVNKDCVIDYKDVAELAYYWLICTDPNDPNCMW